MSASLQTNRRLLLAILHQSRPRLNLALHPYTKNPQLRLQSTSTAPTVGAYLSGLPGGYFDRKVKERQTKKTARESGPANGEAEDGDTQPKTQWRPSKPATVPRKHRPNTMRLESVVPPERYAVDSDGTISDVEPRYAQRTTTRTQTNSTPTMKRGESINVASGHVIAIAAAKSSSPSRAPSMRVEGVQNRMNNRQRQSFPARSGVQRQSATPLRYSRALPTTQGHRSWTPSPSTQPTQPTPAQSTPPSNDPSASETHAKLEPWRVQKAALKTKFADTGGWNPRKRLSPETIDGIRHLHESQPEKHSTEALAKEFKISPEAIRRIVKSRWRPSEAEVEDRAKRWARRHDRIWDVQAEMGLRPPRGGKERGEEDPGQWEEEMGKRELLRAYGHDI